MDEEKAKSNIKGLIGWIVGDLSEDDKKRISPTFLVISVLYTCLILISNIIACKIWHIGNFIVPAAVLTYIPLYIISDLETEVYGFKLSFIPIKMNALMNILMSVMFLIAILLPPASFWPNQEAMKAILGTTWRICIFSILGSFVGDYLNSVTLSMMKVWQKGKRYPVRSILSSVIGQIADTGIFIAGAFAFTMPWTAIFTMMICQYVFKIAYEACCLPISCKCVAWLKETEGDYYDDGDLNTYSIK